jgi:hypothetical protein
LRDISPYKGTPGDPLDAWFAQLDLNYDDFVTVQGATELRFVAAAARTLQEAAVVWWQSLPAASRPTTWSTMKAALRQQFQPVDTEERARDSLMQLKQTAKQSVVEYAGTFRRLLTRCGPSFASAPAMRDFLTERFISGLHSADIRRELKKSATKGLNAAIEMATRLDHFEDSDPESDLDPPASGLAAADATPAGALRSPSEDTDLTTLTRRVTELEATVRSLVAAQPSHRSDRSENDRDRQQVPGLSRDEARRRMDSGRCLYCGREGHVVRDCPDRAPAKPPTLTQPPSARIYVRP